MDPNNEFRKYAIKHVGINSHTLDDYGKTKIPDIYSILPSQAPYVLEERKMNVTQMDVFSRLMMDRILFLGEGVDSRVANIIQAQLLFLESSDPKRDVQIFINSPGGSVIAGQGIYDTMQYIAPDVATICTGMAASMGAVLLCAGATGKRACLPHSRVMIHQPLGGMQGQVTDMEISYNLIKALQKELYDILAKHTGQDYDTIFEDCKRDNWMRAAEAKEYGLIDEVLDRSK